MEKRYQVFVSSTYTDLIEARGEVMQAILELNCMPAGMELFPAANEEQWNWIKKVIDESDYYIVVVAGRYGSVSARTQMSYTEMEYRYAIDIGKPVIGFLHEHPDQIPSSATEQDAKGRKKLDAFKGLVKSRLCKFWSSPTDLGAKVSRSLTQLIKQHPAVGWVRADQVPTQHSSDELLALHARIRELETQLERGRIATPIAQKELASGKERYTLRVHYKRKKQEMKSTGKYWVAAGNGEIAVQATWDDIFAFLAPEMLVPISDWDWGQLLDRMARYFAYPELEQKHKNERFEDISISSDDERTVTIHLRALGLIEMETDSRRWKLTDHGDRYMTKLLAQPKRRSTKSVDKSATR